MIFQNYQLHRRAMIDTNFIHWYYVRKIFGNPYYITPETIRTNILLGNIKVADVPDYIKDWIYTTVKGDSPYKHSFDDLIRLMESK